MTKTVTTVARADSSALCGDHITNILVQSISNSNGSSIYDEDVGETARGNIFICFFLNNYCHDVVHFGLTILFQQFIFVGFFFLNQL